MTSVVGTWRLVRAVARNADGKELPTGEVGGIYMRTPAGPAACW